MSNVNSGVESRGEKAFRRASAIGVVSFIAIGALLLGDLFSTAVNPSGTSPLNAEASVGMMAGIAASFVGMALGGFIYLVATGRGIEYIDIDRPSRETVKQIGLGAGLSVGMLVVFNIVVMFTGLPVAESWVTSTIGENLQIALLFIGVVFVFNAPAEEFLFRGVVQERLSETFSMWSAIIITSGLFTSLHVPAYLMTSTVAETVGPTVIVFGGAVIFGWLYKHSENIMVPAIAHGIFNAIQLAVYIVAILA